MHAVANAHLSSAKRNERATMKGKRSPGTGLFDKLILPRIENYGQNNDITDTDAVCEYLRRNYKEYNRQKLPALRQQVERAVEAIARRGGVTKAELRLQVRRSPRPPANHACAASCASAAVECFSNLPRAPAACTRGDFPKRTIINAGC